MFGIPTKRAIEIEQSASEIWHKYCAGRLPVLTRKIIVDHGILLYKLDPHSEFEACFDLRHPPYELGLREPTGERRSRRRQRFTEAHELGHFFHHLGMKMMHRETKENIVEAVAAGNYVLAEEENEANFFAASLLMPRSSFEEDVRGEICGGQDWPETLMSKYDVSYQAVETRFARLRGGNVLSGFAWADSGRILSMIPSWDLELSEPEVAREAWRCNPIVQGHVVRKLPFRILHDVAAQVRALPGNDIAGVGVEIPNLPIHEILPGLGKQIEGNIFICACQNDGRKLFFEIEFSCVQS